MRWPALILAILLLAALFAASWYDYLLFHSLAELFSIVIAGGIFMIAWNSRRFIQNGYLMLLGIASLFIGGLDLVHTLAYKGMGVFPNYGTNLPTQLWVAARGVESLSLALAPLVLQRRVRPELLFGGYTVVTGLLLWSIFGGAFPDCFVEPSGLTPFKRASEYLICAVLTLAIAAVLRSREHFDRRVLNWLVWSLVLTIGSELAFTSYVTAYGASNLIGHYLKILAFFLVYKAIIETGLSQPYALLFRDLKQSEESLERKVQERTAKLQESIADLEQVSYSIVHDLRAPLRAMQSFAGFVLEDAQGKLEGSSMDFLRRIMASAQRLDDLIRDVLSYAKVARGEFELGPVDLSDLTREVLRSYPAFQAEAGQIEICGPLKPVRGHSALLTQCISNLLDNAFKFVPPGRRPKARIWTEELANGWVRYCVQDQGIGIESEQLQRIWQIFERLHHTQEYPGTGIGLSVVKRAVERMGGTVGAQSQPGVGSTFWFQLPSAPAQAAGQDLIQARLGIGRGIEAPPPGVR